MLVFHVPSVSRICRRSAAARTHLRSRLAARRDWLLGSLVVVVWLSSGSNAGADHYTERVKPLLAEKCIACHGPLRSEAGLRLDAAVFIRKGADDGLVVVEGQPEKSALLKRVSTNDADERMPPEGEGVALTSVELAIIQKWIADGLPSPADETYVASPHDHWAYQPITRPEMTPATEKSDGFSRPDGDRGDDNAIDGLLANLQHQRGIQRLPSADPETWLRRVTMDLNGLPPTPTEVEQFLADSSPDARSRVVERLLARPAYGERWGRHWMDVWRYSDWDGYKQELRGSQRHIWHWRDWIIESLNADKPYNQMIVEMLAGDEIAPTDTDVLRATGFLARNYHRSNRNIWLDATVEHTAKAFLGMTLACARCHDHKYDPIMQEQYYQFRAIFEPHEVRTEPIAGEPDLNKAGIPRVFDAKPEAKTFLLVRGNEKQPREDTPMQPGVPAGLDLPFDCSPVPLPPIAYQPALAPAAEANAMQAAWERLEKARQGAEPKLNQLREQARWDAVGDEQLDPVEEALLEVHAAEAALVALRARYRADHAKADGASDDQLQGLVRKAAVAEQHSNLLSAKLAYHNAVAALEAARAAAAAEDETKPADATQAGAKPADAKQAAAKRADAEQATAVQVKKPAATKPAATKPAATKPAATKPAAGQAGKKAAALVAAEKNVTTQREAWVKAQEASKTEATTYTPVGAIYPHQSTGRRLALARWITDPRNPLTARVAANQIWLRHFGTPLVDDVADFGLRAKRPETATLLDWLANELLTSGWDMKHLHRQIVLSQTYGLTSDTSGPGGAQVKALDPENRLFARAGARRLDAEEIRDSLLAVADHLDRSVGGPDLSEDDGEKIPRRSVYFRHAYEKQVAMLVLFDGPSPNECYRRSPSILPQQALALANSQLSRELSRRLAQRLHHQSVSLAGGNDWFIDQLFLAVLCRHPSSAERQTCAQFLYDPAGSDAAVSPKPSDAEDAAASTSTSTTNSTDLERRQSLAHALLNHNDFVVAR